MALAFGEEPIKRLFCKILLFNVHDRKDSDDYFLSSLDLLFFWFILCICLVVCEYNTYHTRHVIRRAYGYPILQLQGSQYGKRYSIHVDGMQGESSCLHVVCTPDRLKTNGEASLIPDDKSRIGWNPRLDERKNPG